MAESAVFFMLKSLSPFLQQEVILLSGVRDEIEFIRDEFERMTTFLRVADAMEENHPELKTWVKQVREAAYDTADVLDVFMLRLGHQHGGDIRGFLSKVWCFIKTIKARRQIASDVQRIKSRVTTISQGHARYNGDHGGLKLNRGLIGGPSKVENRAWYDRRSDALLLDEAELVGIEKPKLQLIKWMVDGGDHSSRLKVISVVGMGGLGKTTLTKKVFDDPAVKKHFQNHIWITVSESFNLEVLLKRMIQQICDEDKIPIPYGVDGMDRNSLKQLINAILQQKRYVLVLDDVWNINAWQSFRYAFPDGNCSSRVIVTTRNVDLASISSKEYSHGNVYHLQPLLPEDSWTLFCRKAFQGKNSCPPHLKELSEGIVRRCKGLPLAIVTIGGLLSTKDERGVDEWERIYNNLGTELEGNDKLVSLNKILWLSYMDLPHYLKLCFLYLSAFPEDCLIDHSRLIRLWVAEGFVQAKEGMTLEEVAGNHIKDLINRCLIQLADTRFGRKEKEYRVHDLWGELIASKSREQNIMTIARKRGVDATWPEKVRRLSINSGHLENIQQSNKRFDWLRSLLVFGGVAVDSKAILSKLASVSGGIRLLTVLDLGDSKLETFPNEVLKLIHLRYLSLRETKVKIIPKLIGNLRNLETLDLKDAEVTELPVEILKLKQLRHLIVRRRSGNQYPFFWDPEGFKSPVGIGCLSSLQTLHDIYVNHDKYCGGDSVLEQIGKLTQLRALGIMKLQREYGGLLCSSLEKLKDLRSLAISAIHDEILDIHSLSLSHLPPLIELLYLKGHLHKVPHWIPSLHNVSSVHFRDTMLGDADELLQSLAGLPNLLYLDFDEAYVGEGLCFKAGTFQRLKDLFLVKLRGLRWVRVEAGSMPHLEKLCIWKCKLVEELPSGIEHLTKLEFLDLTDMSDKLISSLGRDVPGGDYGRIKHIPQVLAGEATDDGFRRFHL